eukprot:TRINITY_DN4213_c0_g1_i1.p1 TRINITY_DN4213_c0_g1~~TRINITY_DN4213_c0_g1_i1.p1  ORF type:complete len:1667 (-),score=381.11 TRINITY_DN4213_c0_g1_i1:112-4392(-)
MKEFYDVIVVGSGYGGSIAACRSACAGKSVCLLEKGKEYQPGEFPTYKNEVKSETQISRKGKTVVENPLGLFEYHDHDDFRILKGCGLGGTSLFNAGISIRPEIEVMQDESWPEEVRGNALDKYFSEVEVKLQADAYPFDSPKARELNAFSENLDDKEDCFLLPLTINYQTKVNDSGRIQNACTGCGNCLTGCNIGAKNSVDMQYLPEAIRNGAEIFTRTEVRYIVKEFDGTWSVFYRKIIGEKYWHTKGLSKVSADTLILAAGSLGTTEILMRSKQNLKLSHMLGKNVSGRGTKMGVIKNTMEDIGTGVTEEEYIGEMPGPTSTAMIQRFDEDFNSFLVSEVTLPVSFRDDFNYLLGILDEDIVGDNQYAVCEKIIEKEANNNLPFLVQCHDEPDGMMKIINGKIRAKWDDFPKIGKENLDFVGSEDDVFLHTDWPEGYNKRLVTCPLGGCIMGNNAEEGVVNHKGQVFSGKTGSKVYKGLYVMDGSIVPRSVIYPIIVISSLAERCMDIMIKENHWDEAPVPFPRLNPLVPKFHAEMKFTGHVTTDVTNEDWESVNTLFEGKEIESFCHLSLQIYSNNIDHMLRLELPNEPHSADVSGIVRIEEFGKIPFTIKSGNLFINPEGERFYEFSLYRKNETREKETYFMEAYHINKPLGCWHYITSLCFKLRTSKDGLLVAVGKVFISRDDIITSINSVRILDSNNRQHRLKLLRSVGTLLYSDLFFLFGSIAISSPFTTPKNVRQKRPLRTPTPFVYYCTTKDGANIRLLRYKGGIKGPVLLLHDIGVSSSIYRSDTVATNLVEYLVSSEFDVWLLDDRSSWETTQEKDVTVTLDTIAFQDYPMAIETVNYIAGTEKVQIVVHGVMASAVYTSLIEDVISNEVVCSIVSINGSTEFIESEKKQSRANPGLFFSNLREKLEIKTLKKYNDQLEENLLDDLEYHELYSNFIELKKHKSWKKYFDNTPDVLGKVIFLYGFWWHIPNINAKTYDVLEEFFGFMDASMFDHLNRIFRNGHYVNASGEDILAKKISNGPPRCMELPILVLHGNRNETFSRETTDKFFSFLRTKKKKRRLYTKKIIDNYGHLDTLIGRKAHFDVFPDIATFLDNNRIIQINLEEEEKPVPELEKIVLVPTTYDIENEGNTTEGFVRIRKKTFYKIDGISTDPAKKLVVCIHDAVSGCYVWDWLAEHLAKNGFIVLRYDIYGRGRSATMKFDHTGDMLTEQLFDLIEHPDIINLIGERRHFSIIGHGLGACVAMLYSERYENSVTSLTLISPFGHSKQEVPFVRFNGEDDPLGCALENRLYFHDRNPITTSMREFLREQSEKVNQDKLNRAFRNTIANFPFNNMDREIRKIAKQQTPSLFIWGKEDDITKGGFGFFESTFSKSAIVRLFTKAKYYLFLEKRDEVNDIILQFLKDPNQKKFRIIKT